MTLTPVGVGDVPADALALAIRRDGVTARLCIATPLATRWVDRAIGGGELFAPVRALGPAERGVLLALLAPLLDPIGWSFVLGPAQAARRCGRRSSGHGRPGGGHDVAAGAPGARAARAQSTRPRAARLPVDMGVCLASTTLARGALVDVAAGDVVLFDGVAHPDRAKRRLDGRPGGGRFPRGRAHRIEGRATIRPWVATIDNRRDVTMETDETIDSAAAALAAAPVEVVAELGRITLRGDEVLGLAPGVVLGLRVDRTSAVSLRVGGAIWAEGELVNVDGELGVTGHPRSWRVD